MEEMIRQIGQGVALSPPDALESEVMDTDTRLRRSAKWLDCSKVNSEGLGKNRLIRASWLQQKSRLKNRKVGK